MSKRLQECLASVLILLLAVYPTLAGITVSGADGITVSGADGVTYVGTSGITASGADGFLTFGVNGITASGADGITASGADGITASGADGVTYTGINGITASGADGITVSGADGITASGADGITVSGADGARYQADAIIVRQANGITASGADGITASGADGVERVGADGITASGADGITISGADGITVSGADAVTLIDADGKIFSIAPNGITISGADGITVSGADGITISGADGITVSGADGITASGADAQTGLLSLDPELALLINQLTDDRNINVVVVYHHLPSGSDLVELQRIGIVGGTRFRSLPMIALSATRDQIISISRLPAVRSIYSNRTLQATVDPYLAITGAERARQDADLTRNNAGLPVSGRNVTVAVLDTGLDGTHGDLADRVVQNVKLADTQSLSVGFTYPANVENMRNTDQLYGHGTFVAGLIAGNGSRSNGKAGNGSRSNGKFDGIAPGAKVVGLSAGDLTLSFVLAGFDYVLTQGANLNVRVINCSFSANTVFDTNDPVNVATKMLVDRNVNVVFSAGNTGSGLHTLNPYAVAPWVISVGATDESGRLADFSSRGDFGSSLFRPTLVAPGVNVVSLRSSAANLTGTLGVGGADLKRLSATEIPYYTTASGTSFSAPQVAGAIALMLEANARLTPVEIKDILQRSATPLPPYYQHEVGAGMLNIHAAVLEAAFPQRRMGRFRATLDRGQVRFINEPVRQFAGTVQPGASFETDVVLPENALLASVQIGWPFLSTNDLGLSLFDARGARRAEANTINLPGLTGNRERTAVKLPSAGTWRVRVANTLSIAATSQSFSGALEVTRGEYGPLKDLGELNSASREDAYQALRSYVMYPIGSNFRPKFAVSRLDLAVALVLGGRVPQYLPGQPSYADVRDGSTMIFVESAQAASGGSLFPNASAGGQFRPDTSVDRLTAAVALVRAAGLRAEAEARAGTLLTVTDASSIPAEMRGYVAVALERGLLTMNGTEFRAGDALTRIELAHAMITLAKLATK